MKLSGSYAMWVAWLALDGFQAWCSHHVPKMFQRCAQVWDWIFIDLEVFQGWFGHFHWWEICLLQIGRWLPVRFRVARENPFRWGWTLFPAKKSYLVQSFCDVTGGLGFQFWKTKTQHMAHAQLAILIEGTMKSCPWIAYSPSIGTMMVILLISFHGWCLPVPTTWQLSSFNALTSWYGCSFHTITDDTDIITC